MTGLGFFKLLNCIFTFNYTDHNGSKGPLELLIPMATQTKYAKELTEVNGKINSQYQGNTELKAWADIRVHF